jgi:hypothetical protein
MPRLRLSGHGISMPSHVRVAFVRADPEHATAVFTNKVNKLSGASEPRRDHRLDPATGGQSTSQSRDLLQRAPGMSHCLSSESRLKKHFQTPTTVRGVPGNPLFSLQEFSATRSRSGTHARCATRFPARSEMSAVTQSPGLHVVSAGHLKPISPAPASHKGLLPEGFGCIRSDKGGRLAPCSKWTTENSRRSASPCRRSDN